MGVAGTGAGAQIMVAITDPREANRFRQRQSFDLGAAAERVALALYDQGWALQILKMLRSQLIELAWRMKWITEANESRDRAAGIKFVCNEARDTSAERLAADQQLLTPASAIGHCPGRVDVFGHQGFRSRWRTFRCAFAPRRHVFEFEAGHRNSVAGNQPCHAFEKRGCDPHPRAVCKYEPNARILLAVFNEVQRVRSDCSYTLPS